MEQAQADEQRRRLENDAQSFAHMFGVRVDSIEFIQRLNNYVVGVQQQEEHYRMGIREDGLCIEAGITVQQWHNEQNASVARQVATFEEAETILGWLQTQCPLLWTAYQKKCKQTHN
jgi:hypothetical protein